MCITLFLSGVNSHLLLCITQVCVLLDATSSAFQDCPQITSLMVLTYIESWNRGVIDCYRATSIYMMVTTTITKPQFLNFVLMRQVSAIPYWDCHFPKYVVREQCSSPWTWLCPDQQTGSLSHLISSITAGTGSCGIMVSSAVSIGWPQVRIAFQPQSAHRLGVLWTHWGDRNHSWISFTSWIRLYQVQALSWSPQFLCPFPIFAGLFWSELSSGRIRGSPEGFLHRGLL